MSKLKVLVVGASIAGPTAAYWLAKAGASVTVIERFPKLRTGGQNIDIRTAGVTVMRRMAGMEAAVRAKTIPIQGLSWVRADGTPYGTMRPTGDPDQQSVVSEFEIYRGDLAQILVDLTKDNENIKYIFGEQVASMQQNEKGDGPILVKFANGLAATEYDLVVACDGSTSRTRAAGLDCGVRDHMVPLNTWAAYFSVKHDIVARDNIGRGFSAVGGRWMAAGSDPAGGSRVALMAINRRDDDRATERFREAHKRGDDALKQFVAQTFQGSGWIAEEIIKAMMESEDFYATEIVQVKLPSLSKGRFVLVGDAGYASGFTGGGTTLAMAGAYLLAGELNRHKGDVGAGLRAYEERMKPIIKDLQKMPPGILTILAPQTAWGIWLRNHIFAFITWTRILDVVQRFFGAALGHTDQFKLPEYEWVA